MAKTSENTESKSLKPEGLEDKSLAPKEVEDKAVAAPAPATVRADTHVDVIVAHPIPAGRIGNSEALRPGQSTRVTRALAASLVAQGVVRYA